MEKKCGGSLVEIRKYNFDDIKQFTDLMPDLGYPSSLDEMKVRMKRIESNPNYYTFVLIGLILMGHFEILNRKASLFTRKAFHDMFPSR